MDELITVLRKAIPDVNFETDQKLVTDGVISSLSFVMIFSEISDYYGIEIPFEEMIPKNFDSLTAILNLINRLRK